MTKPEAHRLLDAARAGADVSPHALDAALRATGDLDAHLGDDNDPTVQVRRPAGTWERSIATALLRRAGPFDGLAA